MAEFIADIFLCPLESTRIRMVSEPTFASGMLSGMPKLAAEQGFIKGFYSGPPTALPLPIAHSTSFKRCTLSQGAASARAVGPMSRPFSLSSCPQASARSAPSRFLTP